MSHAIFILSVLLFAMADSMPDRGAVRRSTAMVRIPAGVFVMGSNEGALDEKPQHQVTLKEFFIDRTPVTNTQFAEFLNAAGTRSNDGQRWYDTEDADARIHRRDGTWAADSGSEEHPAVEVSWYGAVAYCAWAGKRLPTEAEWEKAARGTDGRKYPWGNEVPDANRAHFGAGWNETQVVGRLARGASPYGILDLAGSVWEWVSSAYLPYPYEPTDGREDLTRAVVRGTRGGGHDSGGEDLTATNRGRHVSRNPRSGHHNIGFRCAR
jgi:iron(II)-dependent oxidoreductase